MRWAIVLIGLALTMACDSKPRGADGYTFGEPTWEQTDLRVRVVLVDSLEDLRRIGPKDQGRELYAFAKVSPAGECTIYKVDSRRLYLPEWDGHELNHCIYGEWHK